ncbi:MAG: AAA family ATPase [Christensenellales bacterium]|jgi:exonuclease SbcC
MRPLFLKMTAFGPYADTVSLNMETLGETGLYAITGETGAGKTTIFDAIVFALYGKGSGSDRSDGEKLRSKYASDDVETQVELRFLSKGKEYTIRRSPTQVVRGNKTPTPHKAALYMSNGDIVTRIAEIDQRIEEDVIGVDANRFSQIVMIAQGEFQKLISADTKERTETLRRIFKTHTFQALQERLAEKARAKEEEYKVAEREKEGALKAIEGDPETAQKKDEADYRAADAERAEREKALDAAKSDYKKGEERNKLLELAENIDAELKALDAERDARQAAFKTANAEKEHIEAIAAQITRDESVLPKYAELSKQTQEASRVREEMQEHDKAVRDADRQIEEIGAENDKLVVEEQSLSGASERKHKADIALRELRDRRKKLTEVKERVTARDDAEKACTARKAEAEGAKSEHQKALAEKSALESELKKLENAQGILAQCTAELDALEAKEKSLRETMLQLSEYGRAKTSCESASIAYEREKATAQRMEEDARAKRDAYNYNVAGYIAEDLIEGEKCPVCGSTHHPQRAVRPDTAPTKNEVEQAEKAAKLAREKADRAEMECKEREVIRREKRAQLAEKLPNVEEAEWKVALERESARNKSETENARAEKGKAKEAELKRKRLSEIYLPEAERKEEQLRKTANEAERSLGIAIDRRHVCAEEAQKALRDISGDMTEDELDSAIFASEKEISALENTISEEKANEKRLTDIGQQKQALQALEREQTEYRATSMQKAEGCRENAKNLAERIAELRKDLPYSSREEAERSIEAQSAEKERLEKAIEDARQARDESDRQYNQKRGESQALKEQLKGVQKADLTALEAAQKDAQKAYDEADRKVQKVYARQKQNLDNLSKYREKEALSKVLEEESRMMTNISKTANGTLPGTARISFETFAQMTYFDWILDYANLRLRHMTNGQYEMRRSETGRGAAKTGLEISVLDHKNATEREIATLSGGEKFLAALAFALGMSDAVQKTRTASVHLETMFVDEGFGTLSEKYLTLALEELAQTAREGHRLIGMISHVSEVKDGIGKRIEVTKRGMEGSSARIVL